MLTVKSISGVSVNLIAPNVSTVSARNSIYMSGFICVTSITPDQIAAFSTWLTDPNNTSLLRICVMDTMHFQGGVQTPGLMVTVMVTGNMDSFAAKQQILTFVNNVALTFGFDMAVTLLNDYKPISGM